MQANDVQFERLNSLLTYHHYQSMQLELARMPQWQTKELNQLIELAQAVLATDLALVEQKAQHTRFVSITKGSILERKAYYFLQKMTLQLHQQEYDNYLRALTPLLVDVLRLAIERDFMPNLTDYIEPIKKETDEGIDIYRGVQWSQSKIEASPNIIANTWRKYYGGHFNYSHYVSSSHLIKLIETNSKNPALVELVLMMRQIEKYLRNLAAHEVLPIDEAYFKERIQKTPQAVHQLLLKLYNEIGLTDSLQRNLLSELKQAIGDALNRQLKKLKESKK